MVRRDRAEHAHANQADPSLAGKLCRRTSRVCYGPVAPDRVMHLIPPYNGDDQQLAW